MGAGLADAGKREETAAKRLRSTNKSLVQYSTANGRGKLHILLILSPIPQSAQGPIREYPSRRQPHL